MYNRIDAYKGTKEQHQTHHKYRSVLCHLGKCELAQNCTLQCLDENVSVELLFVWL